MQWKINYEDQDWEMDFNKFLTDKVDPFREVPDQSRFLGLVNEVWAQRIEVAEINQGIDLERFENPPSYLDLEAVVGRRAFDRRNNVKIDC